MKLLDRYILGKYLATFFYLVLGLCLIICVIDYSEKSDDFLDAGLNSKEVLLGYYIHLIPYLANFLSPLMIFMSTILVTSRLASNTEIVAMLASGVSFNRILLSYLMGALLLAGVTFALIGWVIPSSNAQRIQFETSYLEDQKELNLRDVHVRLNDTAYAYLQNYNEESGMGSRFNYEVIKGKEHVFSITAKRAFWNDSLKIWKIKNYEKRSMDASGKETYQIIKDTLNLDVGVAPDDFAPALNLHQVMTIPEIKDYIEKEEIRGTGGLDVFRMEYWERFTYPFAILILTFMGVVVSARKSREGIAFQLVIGFVLCFVYYAFLQLGRNFTQSDELHPLLSAWIPNFVFLAAGMVLYRTLPK